MTEPPPPFHFEVMYYCPLLLSNNSRNHTIAFIHLASRLRGKEKKVKSVPPPPPPRPNTNAKSGGADKEPAATIPKTIDARDDARDDSSIRSGLTEPSLSGSETSQKVPPPPPPRPTGSLATPSETHGSILLGEVLTHAETFVKGVVLLQAIFRGRKARKKYALMRYYRGLDKSPSSAKPTASIDDNSGKKEIQPVNTRSVFLSHSVPKTKATVQPTKATASAGNIIFGPRSSATPVVDSAIPTSTPTSSNPDPPSSPNKNPPVSAHPSATPVVASAIPTSTTSRPDPPSPPNKSPPVSAHPSFTPRGGAILQSARELLPQLEDQVRLRKEAEEKKKAAKEEKKAARSVDFSPLERSMKTIEVTIFGSEEPSIEVIEGAVFDPKESKEAQQCAAAAKKVLLRHTTDYIAYLNALLKAHANEGILSINEGIDAIVNELLCFLAMKALGKGPVPSIKIHRAWRIMVQSRPFVYIEMCKAMGASSGFSVEDENFNPEEDGHGHEANVIKEKYEATKSAYTALFQSNPPAEFWPSIHSKDDKVSSIPANHLEFLREENLPQNNGDMLSEIGSDAMTSVSDAMTSVSGMTYDDDSLGTLEPAALLNELQYLAEEQNIDIANLSYDSIVEDIKKMRVWVDKTFF